jgi:hypothetical protein
MAWEWRENNREKVLEALQQGEYEAILASRDGALDALAQLAYELEVLEAVKLIEIERKRAGVPDELALRTLAVLPFVEAMSLSAVANALFEDAGVLLQLGYTAVQIQEGFNQRRGKGNEISTITALSPGCIARRTTTDQSREPGCVLSALCGGAI